MSDDASPAPSAPAAPGATILSRLVAKYRPAAEGLTVFGEPILGMSRDELIAVVAWSAERERARLRVRGLVSDA